MPDTPAPADALAAKFAASDAQATAEARTDALATARFYLELVNAGLDPTLAGELTSTWLDAYLDTDTDTGSYAD